MLCTIEKAIVLRSLTVHDSRNHYLCAAPKNGENKYTCIKSKNQSFIVMMMTSADIRKAFLDFFKSKQHQIVPSAPIVVKNDPTLMFTNAGMNQFKDYFLGNKQSPYPRIADTQKCLRVSGKHNDLEEVGVDTYHHTMFEMLGNWSFGDYFKKEAIEWSWELLTKVLNISKDKLYVTVFEGDEKEGLPKDEEGAHEWEKWISKDRILMGKKKDNFWEMGDTGPCGPCTEIHIDCRTDAERKKIDGKTLVNADHPQVIEIWNNVFIQFNRLNDGSLQQLPAKHVDTGMGFERLVRVIQQKNSNYDTDVFMGTIREIEKLVTPSLGNSLRYSELPPDSKQAVACRVIADHIRAISFTIADGQLPSNTGAGYVIRRILRRAVRYYYSYLYYRQPLLHQLVPVIANQFADVFPELKSQEEFVTRVVREEEEMFLRTLGTGMKLFNEYVQNNIHELARKVFRDTNVITNNSQSLLDNVKLLREAFQHAAQANLVSFDEFQRTLRISGEVAFKLQDTHGFPIDLTELMAKEIGGEVDYRSYEEEMQKQKERSRAATAIDTEDWIIVNDGNTSEFIGYDSLETETKILKYRKVKAKGKEAYQIVLDKTPFYAESGGQVGDTGELKTKNEKLKIVDTKKENDLIIHFAEKLLKEFDEKIIAKVDAEKRKSTAVHHSATHLLHAALRKILGTHVAQKGSLVNADYLRFDFSHFSKMTDEEIKQAEQLVNEKIRENIPVIIRFMPKEEAMKTGAMALFGEKYGDVVRVVTIDPNYSVELCGGTHVGATGELGFFKITSETSIAAGVRRIEAICGWAAEKFITEQAEQLRQVKEILKNPKDLLNALNDLMNDKIDLQKTKNELESLQAHVATGRLILKKEMLNSINFYHDVILDAEISVLKKIYSELNLKDKVTEKAVAFLVGTKNDKLSILLGCTESLKEFDCNKIVKEQISPLINGGGGGQKNLATGTGTDKGKIDLAVKKIKDTLYTCL